MYCTTGWASDGIDDSQPGLHFAPTITGSPFFVGQMQLLQRTGGARGRGRGGCGAIIIQRTWGTPKTAYMEGLQDLKDLQDLYLWPWWKRKAVLARLAGSPEAGE